VEVSIDEYIVIAGHGLIMKDLDHFIFFKSSLLIDWRFLGIVVYQVFSLNLACSVSVSKFSTAFALMTQFGTDRTARDRAARHDAESLRRMCLAQGCS
jgi:hypothetical protein